MLFFIKLPFHKTALIIYHLFFFLISLPPAEFKLHEGRGSRWHSKYRAHDSLHAHLLKAWTDRQNLGRKKLSRKEGDQSPFLLSSQPALAHFIQKEACGSTDHQSSCNSAMAFVREDQTTSHRVRARWPLCEKTRPPIIV